MYSSQRALKSLIRHGNDLYWIENDDGYDTPYHALIRRMPITGGPPTTLHESMGTLEVLVIADGRLYASISSASSIPPTLEEIEIPSGKKLRSFPIPNYLRVEQLLAHRGHLLVRTQPGKFRSNIDTLDLKTGNLVPLKSDEGHHVKTLVPMAVHPTLGPCFDIETNSLAQLTQTGGTWAAKTFEVEKDTVFTMTGSPSGLVYAARSSRPSDEKVHVRLYPREGGSRALYTFPSEIRMELLVADSSFLYAKVEATGKDNPCSDRERSERIVRIALDGSGSVDNLACLEPSSVVVDTNAQPPADLFVLEQARGIVRIPNRPPGPGEMLLYLTGA